MKPLLICLALALAACTTTPGAYPANDQAKADGLLRVRLTKTGLGSGPFTATMPDGEVLRGRYSVMLGGSVGWGSLYGAAYGPGGSASFSGASTSTVLAVSSPAVGDAVGPSGRTVHCEVMNNNYTGRGNGVCETDTGARYRIQY